MSGFPFATKVGFSPQETEIRAWIKANRKTLEGRSPNEIAHLAILCGFDISDVCMTLSNFRDAMEGSNIDNRAAFQGWLFDKAVGDFMKLKEDLARVPELDLRPQWKELVANTVTGEGSPLEPSQLPSAWV